MAKSTSDQELARSHAGGKPGKAQQRKIRKDGWTHEKRQIFLDTLAETCNVRASGRAAGMKADSAYVLRKRDSGFAEAWDEAIAMAYDRLELVMLERATHGTEKPIVQGGKKVGSMRDYSDGVGIRLLKAHRDRAMRMRQRQQLLDPHIVLADLRSRLEAIHRRMVEEDGEKQARIGKTETIDG